MSEHHSTTPATASKPAKPDKPYPEFPLFPHAAGVWAKKIRGKMHYFGPWDDPDEALASYLKQKDDLHAGRTPRAAAAELTVKELVNTFLNAKRSLVDSGELSARMWMDYKEAADEVVAAFGKGRLVSDLRAEDFEGLRKRMAGRWGPVRLGNVIGRVRSIFKYADESDLIERPVRFGPGFKRPTKKTMRLHRAQNGARMLEAEEVRTLLTGAATQLKAMILLGVNAGFGNTDCASLPLEALDLHGGWIDFPRPKTGIPRRVPLWPETVAALREVLAARPKPKPEADGLVFVNA